MIRRKGWKTSLLCRTLCCTVLLQTSPLLAASEEIRPQPPAEAAAPDPNQPAIAQEERGLNSKPIPEGIAPHPNGVETLYTYDALNRLRSLTTRHGVAGWRWPFW
jgi:hypothetical protein